jgi:NADH-quinone oxidoreductase subunit A
MVDAYVPVLLFILVALAFGIVTLLMARLVVPQRYSRVKLDPYECGIEPKTDARDRYSVRYFLVAMLFLIFDVETVFMYPWAVIVDQLAWFGFIEMVVFIFILVVGYFYAWREGALEWAS